MQKKVNWLILNPQFSILNSAQRLIRVKSWTEKSVKMTLLHQLRVICGICVPDLRNLREIEA